MDSPIGVVTVFQLSQDQPPGGRGCARRDADLDLIWVDRNGKQLGVVADKLTNLQAARVSPQGDRVALQIDTGVNDIWVLDVARKVRTRLTFGEPGFNGDPVWAPDGKSPVYDAAAALSKGGFSDIYRINADGSGPASCCLREPNKTSFPPWNQSVPRGGTSCL